MAPQTSSSQDSHRLNMYQTMSPQWYRWRHKVLLYNIVTKKHFCIAPSPSICCLHSLMERTTWLIVKRFHCTVFSSIPIFSQNLWQKICCKEQHWDI